MGDKPDSVLPAIDACEKDVLLNIYKLFLLLGTLPVTFSEAERFFSKLERTKSAIKARMGNERLEGLMMMATHRELIASIDDIITKFATSGAARRLNIVM